MLAIALAELPALLQPRDVAEALLRNAASSALRFFNPEVDIFKSLLETGTIHLLIMGA